MSTCPYCLATIAGEAQKCMHCGEWIPSQDITREPENIHEIPSTRPEAQEREYEDHRFSRARLRRLRKPGSSYDLGGKGFGAALIGLFVCPPLSLVAIILGIIALARNRGDQPGWAIAAIVLGVFDIVVWVVLFTLPFAL